MVANTRIWIILLITLFGGVDNAESYRTYYGPPQTISSINYQIGHRLQGDAPIAQFERTYHWPFRTFGRLLVQYPGSGGYGATVTCVTIQTQQDASGGKTYVVRGGLQQRYILVAVEAYGVTSLVLKVQFFGLA